MRCFSWRTVRQERRYQLCAQLVSDSREVSIEVLRVNILATLEAQRAIDLLQQRRTALIYAANTGQIDVWALS